MGVRPTVLRGGTFCSQASSSGFQQHWCTSFRCGSLNTCVPLSRGTFLPPDPAHFRRAGKPNRYHSTCTRTSDLAGSATSPLCPKSRGRNQILNSPPAFAGEMGRGTRARGGNRTGTTQPEPSNTTTCTYIDLRPLSHTWHLASITPTPSISEGSDWRPGTHRTNGALIGPTIRVPVRLSGSQRCRRSVRL